MLPARYDDDDDDEKKLFMLIPMCTYLMCEDS